MTPVTYRRFGLRAMLIVVTCICLVLGWLTNEYRVVRQRAALLATFQSWDSCIMQVTVYPRSDPDAAVIWWRKRMGDAPQQEFLYRPELDANGLQLKRAQELFPEARFWVHPSSTHIPGTKELPPSPQT